jgi:hypothetical protein
VGREAPSALGGLSVDRYRVLRTFRVMLWIFAALSLVGGVIVSLALFAHKDPSSGHHNLAGAGAGVLIGGLIYAVTGAAAAEAIGLLLDVRHDQTELMASLSGRTGPTPRRWSPDPAAWTFA